MLIREINTKSELKVIPSEEQEITLQITLMYK